MTRTVVDRAARRGHHDRRRAQRGLRWLLVPIALLACAPAMAAPTTPGPSGAPMEQRFQKVRSRVLREKVGLAEEKARKVEVILDRYAPERKRLTQELRQGRQKLRALLTLDSQDQAAYRSALDQVRTNRKALQDLMERAFGEIAKELTPKEQGKLFLALDELRQRGNAMRRRFHGAAAGDDDGDG
jgi:Spy/CpxP family protein refolding chaperone